MSHLPANFHHKLIVRTGFEKRVFENWPLLCDQVIAIVRRPRSDDDEGVSSRQHIANKVEEIDKLLGGFGTEAVFGDQVTWPDMEYVNFGDTYDTTIVFDYVEEKWLVTSWGAWIEDAERKGRHYE